MITLSLLTFKQKKVAIIHINKNNGTSTDKNIIASVASTTTKSIILERKCSSSSSSSSSTSRRGNRGRRGRRGNRGRRG